MTARVLTGSKQEIAQQLTNLRGQVRQSIVFIEEPAPPKPVPATAQELFAEMEPYSVKLQDLDDSRQTIYTRLEGE